MNWKIIICISLLFSAQYGISQQAAPKFTAEISLGSSLPVAKFGDRLLSQDTTSDARGLSETQSVRASVVLRNDRAFLRSFCQLLRAENAATGTFSFRPFLQKYVTALRSDCT
jgi:hypothetical protein